MSARDRILNLLNKEAGDRIPFAHCDRHLPRGEKERRARNMGMALLCYRPCYIEYISNVEITTRSEPDTIIRTYKTAAGSLSETLRVGVGYGQALFGRDWKGLQPIRTQFLVKEKKDYRILKSMAENLHFKPYYYPVEDQAKRLGEDGIVISTIPYEPMQRLLIEWVGSRLYVDLAKDRETVEEIYETLEKRYEEELFPIAADSPSEVVLYGGNIDSVLVNPQMLERYYLPTYEKCSKILHSKGRLLDVHMDGKLKSLLELIAESKVDIVEAFTPPPMGDLPIETALQLWKDKIIWINFPSTISTAMGPRPSSVKEYLLQLLEKTIPGNRIMLIASTENFVPEENIIAMAEVMGKATLPLTKDVIEKIRIESRL
ncbi:MAG: hypothetical protein ACUVQ8_03340 [Nitrososphaeria archaeon]